MRHYQILSKSVKRLQRYSDLTVFFQNGGRPPSWICWAPIGTTHDDHLVVSIVVQNLVEIDAVVSMTWNCQYFARLAWRRLFTPQNWGFQGISLLKWGAVSTKPPKGSTRFHEKRTPDRNGLVDWKCRTWNAGRKNNDQAARRKNAGREDDVKWRITGRENAGREKADQLTGRENDGLTSRTWKCRKWKCSVNINLLLYSYLTSGYQNVS